MKTRLAVYVVVFTILNLIVVSSLFAVPVIDGRFDATEGYATGYSLLLNVESGKGSNGGHGSDDDSRSGHKKGKGKNKGHGSDDDSGSGHKNGKGGDTGTVSGGAGELWLSQDTASGDVYLAFIQPLSLVDNSYGGNAIGWGKDVAPSGKNHNYKDLTGSDKAQFAFTDGSGNTVLDIVLDYAHVNSSGVVATVTEGDGEVSIGNASDVKEEATSLEYNYNVFGLSNPELFGDGSSSPTPTADPNDYDYAVADSSLTDWVFESVYELRIDGSVFDDNGFGDVELVVVHNSPNKIAKNKVYVEIGEELGGGAGGGMSGEIIPSIPEPTTIALLGIGLTGLACTEVRRRRKRIAVDKS